MRILNKEKLLIFLTNRYYFSKDIITLRNKTVGQRSAGYTRVTRRDNQTTRIIDLAQPEKLLLYYNYQHRKMGDLMKIVQTCLLLLITTLHAGYKHTFINKASHPITIVLTFYPNEQGKNSTACKNATFDIDAGKQKIHKTTCKFESITVKSQYDAMLTRYFSQDPTGDDLVIPGDSTWEYIHGDSPKIGNLIPTKGVRLHDGEMNPTHSITNKSSQLLIMSLEFFGCTFNGDQNIRLEKFAVGPGQKVSKPSPCQLKYIEAEGAYGKNSGYGDAKIRFTRYENNNLTFYSFPGKSSDWVYTEQDGLIPTQGVRFIGKEFLEKLNPTHDKNKQPVPKETTHTIVNKSEDTLYITLKFYGCDDIKDIRLTSGESTTKNSRCPLQYIQVDAWNRANHHSGYPDTTEFYLSQFPALFQFSAIPGENTTWEYDSKNKLIPTQGVEFVGTEKLAQL